MININIFKMKINISLISFFLFLLLSQFICTSDDLNDDMDLSVDGN